MDFATGDCIIPFDADLQHPAEIIPKFIEKYKEGFDIVNAVRFKREGETWLKKTTSIIFYKIINKFSNVKLEPNVGDFRLISRQVLEELKKMPERRRFMKGLFSWVGFKTVNIEYVQKPRNAGKTKWNYIKLINFAIEGITSFSTIPLQFTSVIGVLISIFAFFMDYT